MHLLDARGVTKYFHSTGVLANDGISLSIDEGEIVAIVGENGAGKSTFARILSGLVRPDSGTVELRGRRIQGGSVRDAERAGIGLVPQHSFLAESLTVEEAIWLGREPRRLGFFLDRKEMRKATCALAASAGIELDPSARVGNLPPDERRHAEILRALAWAGDLLILDEPTSSLDEEEIAELFRLVGRLARDGKAIVFITHRAAELAAVATRIVVLRNGRLVADRPASGFSASELPALMSRIRDVPASGHRGSEGEGMSVLSSGAPRAASLGNTVAFARDLVLGASHGKDRLRFEVRSGECLVILALAGNGLEELESVVAGLARPRGGSFVLLGRPVFAWPRRKLRGELAGYVPSAREQRGLVLESSIAENFAVLDSSFRAPSARTSRYAKQSASLPGASLLLGPDGDEGRPAKSLSGGNRQRLVLSRELAPVKPFLLLAEPTQGLDRGGVEDLVAILSDRKARDVALLVLSSSIEEALRLGDRIAILYRGGFVWEGDNPGDAGIHEMASHLTGHSHAGRGRAGGT